ncbi:MATE family efflux transporter [Diplocloster agilis]|uniref:Probable multidrug resistance protein NorM n=1 Tax=Diplocloster agilis TaxID=2850323 RepID=A0A949K0Z1_9FIRM|nr:MATE family efflux transporter [Diplocloster agilis]MBU9738908.1 MATE family efflux transporter [Diplocloster agilis]
MERDLTRGSVTRSILLFAAPIITGNLLQLFYNIADTLIVGRFLGADALAAVGSSYSVMVFLTSIILGLCMGSGVLFSMLYGAHQERDMKKSFFVSFLFIGGITLILEAAALLLIDPLLRALQIPADIFSLTRDYLFIIFLGIVFTFIFNYFAALLRSVGNSSVPLVFLAASALINIVLDLLFILVFHMGVAGAAVATVTAQGISAGGLFLYCRFRAAHLFWTKEDMHFDRGIAGQIAQYSLLTCVQQSVMNFGILMIQGLVNSFGVSVMAAFAAAVKIDSFAYMPVQDFGNAFATYIAQNSGAKKAGRIQKGLKSSILIVVVFCALISFVVFTFAPGLMTLFIRPEETEIIRIGTGYLRIEGACYCGIGCLSLLYGLYRGLGRPGISVILTVISLGTRVGLAYLLAPLPAFGLNAVWWAIPIGWVLADAVGLIYYHTISRKNTPEKMSQDTPGC